MSRADSKNIPESHKKIFILPAPNINAIHLPTDCDVTNHPNPNTVPPMERLAQVRPLAGLLMVVLALVAFTGCQARYPHEPKVIGVVTYMETFGLPAMAAMDVELTDLSAPDGPQRIAHQHITRRLRKPIPFSLRFDPKAILPDHTYALTAQIAVGTNVWFRTPEPIPVITKGNSQVQTVVVQFEKRK